MPDIFSDYPYNVPVNFSFKVIFSFMVFDSNECMFQDVSGINATIGMDPITEGGVNNYTHNLPKPVKYDNITLKRGLYRGSSLIAWVNNALINFTFQPMPVEISLLDSTATPIVSWSFVNAYPVSLKISELSAQGDGKIVIESLELAYSYFTRVDL